MQKIKAIGFDMDWTLAQVRHTQRSFTTTTMTCPSQYKPEHFEALTYRLTVDKLVTVFHYPEVWQ